MSHIAYNNGIMIFESEIGYDKGTIATDELECDFDFCPAGTYLAFIFDVTPGGIMAFDYRNAVFLESLDYDTVSGPFSIVGAKVTDFHWR
jgi:hypothetical protein